jgi:predicted nucleotidyltransferase
MAISREQILRALEELNARLRDRGIVGELCVFGGTAMVLAYSARVSTKDVDALFQPTVEMRDAAREVADQLNLGPDWLNDGVKGFVSSRHDVITGNLPQFSHLRLTMPVPEYLLAMKALAARVAHGPEDAGDLRDLRFLIAHLGLKSGGEVLDVVEKYYPRERITVKTQYVIDAIFEE